MQDLFIFGGTQSYMTVSFSVVITYAFLLGFVTSVEANTLDIGHTIEFVGKASGIKSFFTNFDSNRFIP